MGESNGGGGSFSTCYLSEVPLLPLIVLLTIRQVEERGRNNPAAYFKFGVRRIFPDVEFSDRGIQRVEH